MASFGCSCRQLSYRRDSFKTAASPRTTGTGRFESSARGQNITYQGFSLLTANPHVLGAPGMISVAKRHQKTVCQVVFRFAQQVGMLPLTGTTDINHMREDLDSSSFDLAEEEVRLIETLGAR